MNSALVRSIADLSNRWRNHFSRWRNLSKSSHLRRGVRGEKLACRYLKRSGYKILLRNFRGRTGGEIDVVLPAAQARTIQSFHRSPCCQSFRAKKRATQNAMFPLNAPKYLRGDFECSESTVLGCATDTKPEEQRR